MLVKMGELQAEDNLDVSSDLPGKAGIVDGRLIVEEPVGNGAWPVIIPCEGVKVFVNGEPVSRPFVVETAADVSFHVLDQKPQSAYEILLSPDKMKVTLRTRFVKGMEFKLCDREPAQKLKLKTEPVRELQPQALDFRQVLKEIQDLKIRTRIDLGALASACRNLEDVEAVIAEGIPAQPPVHGRIERVWELQAQDAEESSEEERVDHRERNRILSVDAGDVLAHWHPPIPGKPGRNVFGQLVQPPEPKNAALRAGRGVKLVSGGTVAVAEKAGRPVIRGNVVSVSPQMIIEGNVDLKTGNIRFKGDVVVFGSVCESMEIDAGGQVEVMGDVCQAQITAGADVIVKGKVISSSISAGQHLVGLFRSLALVKKVIPELYKLSAACAQLQQHPNFSTKDLSDSGAGYLIKLLLEMRFPGIPKSFAKLGEILANINCELQEEEFSDLIARMRGIAKCFVDGGPLTITSREALDAMGNDLQHLAEEMVKYLEYPANITASYCQNATLEATGDIAITGSLAYGSDMVAGGSIEIAGDCRCGTYQAKQTIRVGTAGSKGIGKTYFSVPEGGTITAKQFYPGVRLKIGSDLRVINSMWYDHTFRELDSLSAEAANG